MKEIVLVVRHVVAVVVALAIGCLAVPAVSAQQGQFYWSDLDTYTVETALMDGSDRRVLHTGVRWPEQLGVDQDENWIYFIDYGIRTGQRLRRAALDGTVSEILVPGTATGPFSDIVLDLTNRKIYWSESDSNRIRHANLDGTGAADFLGAANGLNYPKAMALDEGNGKLYWLNSQPNRMQRASLDGSNVEDVIDVGSSATGLSIDVDNQHVYWATGRFGEIRRANFDGSGETVVHSGERFIREVAFAGDWIYFNATNDREIRRVPTGGGNTDVELVTPVDGLGGARHMTISDGALFWSARGATNRTNYIAKVASDGAEKDTLFTESRPADVELDEDAGFVFWLDATNNTADGGVLYRAALDGLPEITALRNVNVFNLSSLALDRQAQHIYFISGADLIRTDYDGNIADTVAIGVGTIGGIALDTDAQVAYWLTVIGVRAIRGIRFDGTDERVVIEHIGDANDLELNPSAGQLYWASYEGIRRIDVNGANSTIVLDVMAFDIELDIPENRMYWTSRVTGNIRMANLDGSNIEDVLIEGIVDPSGLALRGTSAATSIREIPDSFTSPTLSAAYPNPFSTQTNVELTLGSAQHVRVDVYDVLGRRVAILHQGWLSADQQHRFAFAPDDLPSGVYFVHASGAGFRTSQQVVYVQE
jgi:hypothetical protein